MDEAHGWMSAKGIKATADGRFQISESVLRTVLEYAKAYSADVANTVIDIERELQPKKN
jgi:hypothetical protein